MVCWFPIMTTFVSVIIPLYNDLRISIALDALLDQTYPLASYEIIVADNGSHSEILKLIETYFTRHPHKIKLTREIERQGSYAARNKALGLARGEILVFTDSDCIPSSNWIESGVSQLNRVVDCGLLGGKIEITYQDPHKPTLVEVYERVLAFQQQAYVTKLHYAATANLFTHKRVFDRVGMFDDRIHSGGDYEWGQRVFRAGYTLTYSDSTLVYHPARRTLDELCSKTVRVIIGRYDLDDLNATHNNLSRFSSRFSSFLRDILPFFGWIRKILLYQDLGGFVKLKLFALAVYMFFYRIWVRIKFSLGLLK
jgi:glycosyltransferase involved in cell wall biosynthesis